MEGIVRGRIEGDKCEEMQSWSVEWRDARTRLTLSPLAFSILAHVRQHATCPVSPCTIVAVRSSDRQIRHRFGHELWTSPRAPPPATPGDDARAAPAVSRRDVQDDGPATTPLRKRAGAAPGGPEGASPVAGDDDRARDAVPLRIETVRAIPTRESIPARSPRQSKDLRLPIARCREAGIPPGAGGWLGAGDDELLRCQLEVGPCEVVGLAQVVCVDLVLETYPAEGVVGLHPLVRSLKAVVTNST